MVPIPEKPVMITTPIYYANGDPHVGHLYTSLLADSINRWCKLRKIPVFFMSGVDEHGQKVGQTAEANGVSPKEWCDKMKDRFLLLFDKFDIKPDRFIRTTDDDHVAAVIAVWNKLASKGLIYKGKYEGWYCLSDEAFVTELNVHDVLNPATGKMEKRTIDSDRPVQWLQEDNYMFKLSEFQTPLLALYDEHPEMILPAFRRDEIIQFVKGGLSDLSVSRKAVKWGIPVPGDESHTIYVWIDALTNYITACGYPYTFDGANNKSHWQDYFNYKKDPSSVPSSFNPLHGGCWPTRYHLIGKDIIKFHCIYWPAFLMGIGVDQAEQYIVHGWWTKDKKKISKSEGNAFDIDETVKMIKGDFSIDAFRYILMKERFIIELEL